MCVSRALDWPRARAAARHRACTVAEPAQIRCRLATRQANIGRFAQLRSWFGPPRNLRSGQSPVQNALDLARPQTNVTEPTAQSHAAKPRLLIDWPEEAGRNLAWRGVSLVSLPLRSVRHRPDAHHVFELLSECRPRVCSPDYL